MFIVIDTTETFDDPLLMGPNWTFVQCYLRREIATLVVPEIVILETINHFPKKLREIAGEVGRSIGRLKKIVPNAVLSAPEMDIEKETTQFTEALYARLNEMGARIPTFKHIEIGRVVQRSLDRRKPFDAHGHRGFRDAILWETILELARKNEGELILLVTENTNDFGPHRGLAADLVDDLKRNGIAADQVTVCKCLHELVETYLIPTFANLEELQLAIGEGRAGVFDALEMFGVQFREISSAVDRAAREWGFEELGWSSRRFYFSPRLADLNETPEYFEPGDVYRTDVDEVFFSITFEVEGVITCELDCSHDPRVAPWSMHSEGNVTFSVVTSLVMVESTGEINSFSVESVKIKPGRGWQYDEWDD